MIAPVIAHVSLIMEEQKRKGRGKEQGTCQHLDWWLLELKRGIEQHLFLEQAHAWIWI